MTVYKIKVIEVPYNDFDNEGNAPIWELVLDKTLAEAKELGWEIQKLYELKLKTLAHDNPERFLPFPWDTSAFTSCIDFEITEVEEVEAQTREEDWDSIVNHLLEWEPYFSNENS